jgi:hypothetical protein
LSTAYQPETKSATPKPAPSFWKREPALPEVLVMWAAAALIFICTISVFRSYWQVIPGFGDSSAYMQIADVIRSWNFSDIQVKHFWGLPYAMAALGKITGLQSLSTLIAISVASSLAALVLAFRLWGPWIALFASMLSFDWLQRSFLGGSEPLFVMLLFAAFLAIRKERWEIAALLASLATITRPLGVCLLIGMGITLIRQRDWKRLTRTTAIAVLIGVLYVLPLRLYLHDPLATVHSYGVLPSKIYPPLFGIPFKAIIVGTLRYSAPLSNLLFSFGWIFLVVAGNVAMVATKEFRDYARTRHAEVIFAALYLLSVYCYNLPSWARGNFARFAIPILPFVFLALSRWLPRDRRVMWCLTLVCSALAAASAIGIHNVFPELRK